VHLCKLLAKRADARSFELLYQRHLPAVFGQP